MENSTKLIETLGSWKKSIDGQIGGFQDQKDVLDQAIKLLTEGYQIDQTRIDEAIKADVDARSQHITDLESKVTEHESTIVTLTSEKSDLQTKVSDLTKATQDSKEALTTVVTTISDALDKAVPVEPVSADSPVL